MSIVFLIFAVLVLAATIIDVVSYTIPNWLVLALLFLFLVVAFAGMPPAEWPSHLIAAGVCFAALALLYAYGAMGAGDTKLMTVVALWAGLEAVMPMLVLISLIALLGMLVILALRRILPLAMKRGWLKLKEPLPRVLRKGEGIPYAIGIGPGAIAAASLFPHWLWQV